jgi:hypothetical protein
LVFFPWGRGELLGFEAVGDGILGGRLIQIRYNENGDFPLEERQFGDLGNNNMKSKYWCLSI